MQKLYVKRVLFTEEKGKEHLQITRGVASSILHIFAVALWKPQRLSIASPPPQMSNCQPIQKQMLIILVTSGSVSSKMRK